MKKTFLTTLTILLLFFVGVRPIYAEETAQPQISGGYGVAIDVKTGEIYYDKNAHEAAKPASMTKLLTAIIIDEKVADDEKIPVSDDALATECSCYGVEKGEELSKKDAINALMIKSANDVAVAAAEHIGGSIEGFAKIMNERAKEIGVSDKTNFVTPNGLDNENHHVTPYDMALILREAIKHPMVYEALTSKDYTAKTNKKEVVIPRHDSIFSLKNAVGGKTGFTSAAGNTLAVYFKEGDKEVISVVMKGTPKIYYNDVETMANYAFSQMKTETIYKANQVVGKAEIGDKKVPMIVKQDFSITYKGQKPNYTLKTELNNKKGDIKAGEEIAKGTVYEGKKIVGEISLVSNQNILADKIVEKEIKNPNGFKLSMWWAIALPWIFYVGYFIFYNVQKRKKIKAKN